MRTLVLVVVAFFSLAMTPQEADAIVQRLHLKNPVIEVRGGKPYQAAMFTCLPLTWTNKSNVHLDYVNIRISLFDAGGDVVASKDNPLIQNLRPGTSKENESCFGDVDVKDVKSWKFVLQSVTAVDPQGELVDTYDMVYQLVTASGRKSLAASDRHP